MSDKEYYMPYVYLKHFPEIWFLLKSYNGENVYKIVRWDDPIPDRFVSPKTHKPVIVGNYAQKSQAKRDKKELEIRNKTQS